MESASDTGVMLGWVYCTNAVDPSMFLTADADEETRYRMERFKKQYEQLVNAPLKRRDKFVQNYIEQQRKTLIDIRGQRFHYPFLSLS